MKTLATEGLCIVLDTSRVDAAVQSVVSLPADLRGPVVREVRALDTLATWHGMTAYVSPQFAEILERYGV